MKFLKASLVLLMSLVLTLVLLNLQPRFSSLPFEEQRLIAAQSIEESFKRNIMLLSAERQGHFFIRLYRLSGREESIPPIRQYAEKLVLDFKTHAQNLEVPGYIENKEAGFLKLPEKPLLKHIYRARYRRAWPGMALAHRLLFLAFQLKSFGLDQNELKDEFEKILGHLRQLTYETYLMDEKMIQYNSTRTVNMVYQLKFLGLGDYEDAFMKRLQKVFMNQPDAQLDKTLYLNKIYALTHLVIAASDFYQHKVSKEKFQWVLNYFEENLDAILTRNTVDTAAEVAVCFKLAGEENHPAVEKVQRFLLSQFDSRRGFFTSERPGFDWNDIEHRNILSLMALSEWEELRPGPFLVSPPS